MKHRAIRNNNICPYCKGTGVVVLPFSPKELVMTIAEHVGGTVFTSAELKDFAEASESSLRFAVNNMTASQLGRALRSIEAQDFDGVRIDRIGREHGVALWRVFWVA